MSLGAYRVTTSSPEETEAAGRELAARLKPGSVVCLYGELGAGKTVFVKGMASGLGLMPRDIISASYTIIAEYDCAPPLYHADLYRLEGGADIDELGLYDYMDGQGITVIEWADRLPDEETAGAIKVRIGPPSREDAQDNPQDNPQENDREIIIEGL